MRSVFTLLLALFLLIGMVGCGTPQTPVGKEYTLTHSVQGEGTVTPITGMKYAAGTLVQLTPTPAYGWAFKSWEGPDAGSVVGSSGSYSIVMDADKTITAVFEKLKHEVITMVTPENGGTVTVSVIDPINPLDVTLVDHGQTISVLAQPAANYEFFRWESDLSGTENPTTMLIEGRTYIDAVFQPVTTGRVTGSNGTQGIAGVVLEYTGAANGQVTTDADGYFSIKGVSGSITITPKSAPGTLWIDAEPANRQVIAPSANVNFSLSSFKYVGAWPAHGTMNGMYGTFGNIALDAQDVLYLVENNDRIIRKFTSDGVVMNSLAIPTIPDTCFLLGNLAIDSSGNIFATCLGGHRLNKYNSSGQLIKSWGDYGTDTGKFNSPMGLAIDSHGDVYVVDNGNHRIQKYSNDGELILSWGSWGLGNGEFNYPSYIAIDGNDNIYVTDSYNYRVQKFSTDGTYMSNWGGAPGPIEYYLQYLSMATDPHGNVWVINGEDNQLLMYSPTGQQLHLLNLITIGPDGSKLQFPGNMVINSQGDLYITDPSHNLVHQFVIED
jgi:hypothetical protein